MPFLPKFASTMPTSMIIIMSNISWPGIGTNFNIVIKKVAAKLIIKACVKMCDHEMGDQGLLLLKRIAIDNVFIFVYGNFA